MERIARLDSTTAHRATISCAEQRGDKVGDSALTIEYWHLLYVEKRKRGSAALTVPRQIDWPTVGWLQNVIILQTLQSSYRNLLLFFKGGLHLNTRCDKIYFNHY